MGKKKRRSSIEEIPEDILIKIVSLLDLKEAVRSSVVSRRWRDLWKHTPRLLLNATHVLPTKTVKKLEAILTPPDDDYDMNKWNPMGSNVGRKIAKKFIHSVDTILQCHHGVHIEDLTISFHFDARDENVLDRWLSFVATSRTKRFSLCCLRDGYLYDFPCHLFSSERGGSPNFGPKFSLELVDSDRFAERNKRLRTLHPERPHCHLKMFNMSGFTGRRRQLELLIFILTNATQLEVMTIDIDKYCATRLEIETAIKTFNKKVRRKVPQHVNVVCS